MSVQIPNLPTGAQTNLSFESFSLELKPTQGGGPTTRASRPGGRWTQQITTRPLDYEQGIAVVAAVVQGLTSRVKSRVEQGDLDIGTPGSPTASSGAGTTLSASGFASGYEVRAGQFFSLTHAGNSYLYMVTEAVTASGGSATLSIYPPLKTAVTSGDPLNFASPQIEGFIQGNSQGWSISLAQSVGITFAITESA